MRLVHFSATDVARRYREPPALLATGALVLLWSGDSPYDRPTWWLEVLPVLVAVPLLWATRRRFPLTPLAYRLILLHAAVLMVGAHYTYARVPLGFWLQESQEVDERIACGTGNVASTGGD